MCCCLLVWVNKFVNESLSKITCTHSYSVVRSFSFKPDSVLFIEIADGNNLICLALIKIHQNGIYLSEKGSRLLKWVPYHLYTKYVGCLRLMCSYMIYSEWLHLQLRWRWSFIVFPNSDIRSKWIFLLNQEKKSYEAVMVFDLMRTSFILLLQTNSQFGFVFVFTCNENANRFFSVCLHIYLKCTGSHQGPHEKRLLNTLLGNYNTLERPVSNESDALTVRFGLTLQQIIDVVSFVLVLVKHSVFSFIFAFSFFLNI